ncbi:MAG: asparaginase [Alphaproteobacteria bacterium]
MSESHHATPGASPLLVDPLLVEVSRGPAVESAHRVALAVVDTDGRVLLAAGDYERPVYPRSAIKPLQAIPLVESGAADSAGREPADIALACASHAGMAMHTTRAGRWLVDLGLSPDDLVCHAHWPNDEATAHALVRAGAAPSRLHNNCSGKHTAMLATARHLGEAVAGYDRPGHPVQQRILGLLEQMGGHDLEGAARAIDGCGLPVIAMPLGAMALAWARFADPAGLADRRATAIGRIHRAMADHGDLLAGPGRFDSVLNSVCGGAVLTKGGAEGVACAAIAPTVNTPGLGIALKVADGAGRAAPVALMAVLDRLAVLSDQASTALQPWRTTPLTNWAGVVVGEIRPVAKPAF